MKHTFFTLIRDILFIIALVALTNYAIYRKHSPEQKNNATKSDLATNFVSHEIDQKFVEFIDAVKKQIITLLQPSDQKYQIEPEKKSLQNMLEEAKELRTKYIKNSPALALLGPIGTTSIVLKEREIANKLLSSLNQIQKVLVNSINLDINHLKKHPLFQTSPEFLINSPTYEHYRSIQEGLEENKTLITKLYNLRDALALQ